MLLDILAIIAPVFLCSLLGLIWVRLGHPFDTATVSRLVIEVGAPCLIFATFMEIELARDAFWRMLGASMLAMLGFMVLGWVVLRLWRLNLRAFLPAQIFPNVGNMGLPLCLLAFGEEGLALGLTYFTVNVVIGFTLGVAISSGSLGWRELLRTPVFHAVIITGVFFLGELRPPAWLLETTRLLADLTIPLMLIALGVSLAGFRVRNLGRSVALSLLRLAGGFVIGWALAELLGLEGVARGVLILQSSMPVAVFAYLFALRYQREPAEVAAQVMLSTLLSFLSLPLLLWFVL